MASHEADAKRRQTLRVALQHERERLEKEHDQLIAGLRADFKQAQETDLLLDRKHLLLALQDRIKNSYGADFIELKEKVTSELGAIEPLVRRGIKTSRPTTQ